VLPAMALAATEGRLGMFAIFRDGSVRDVPLTPRRAPKESYETARSRSMENRGQDSPRLPFPSAELCEGASLRGMVGARLVRGLYVLCRSLLRSGSGRRK